MKRLGLMSLTLFSVVASLMTGAYASAAYMPLMRWTTYRSHRLNLLVTVPSSWTARISSKAVGFRIKGMNGLYAGFGVLKSQYELDTIEENAERHYKEEGQPADWVQLPATVAGNRAIKIIFSPSEDPAMRMVQYYIETPQGCYLVQCIAPKRSWTRFSPIFATALGKIKFTA